MKTANNRREAFSRLYEFAEAQQGFFTTKQAKAAGFDERNHPFHVRSGNWIREHRGIYRLVNFPPADRPDLVLWSLWSRNRRGQPEGVYSHKTALSLYELSDIMPAKLHMTVPRSFRRNGSLPKVLVLHRSHIKKGDLRQMQGFQVTRPLRTFSDLILEDSLSADVLKSAVRDALRKGLLRRSEIGRAKHLPLSTREKLEKIVRELKG